MLTPVGNSASIKAARDVGIDVCLVKPVRQSELYESLVKVMTKEAPHAIEVACAVAEITNEPLAGSRGKILLVEDNLVNQAVALGMLKSLKGFDVVVANNGNEALADYSKGGFDIILMDCHMPELDGFEATMAIRKIEQSGQKRRVPIVALTANAMAQDRQDCLDAGMDDHLAKPLSRKQLQDMLERWLPKPEVSTPGLLQDGADANTADADVLDRQVLAQLRDLQSDDDPDLLVRVMRLYTEESPKLLAKLKQACQDGVALEIERASHALKSSSGNIGATELTRLCNDIHSAARASGIGIAREILPRLEAEFARVLNALAGELA
jgi:CheY-like chemotaxis protein/HPt (histidine-containing phosphotransfer) domain-containing protein